MFPVMLHTKTCTILQGPLVCLVKSQLPDNICKCDENRCFCVINPRQTCVKSLFCDFCAQVAVNEVNQCQLVKNFENRINRLNIGIKCHSGINLETNGVDNTICQAVFLFYCMANKQV